MDSNINYNTNNTKPFNYTSTNTPSPYHTSPQTISGLGSGPGTAGTSPHSSIINSNILNQNQNQSPAVPAYLTRYPSHPTPTFDQSQTHNQIQAQNQFPSDSPTSNNPPISTDNNTRNNNSRRPTIITQLSNQSDLEMYGGSSTGDYGQPQQHQHHHQNQQHHNTWPALPPNSSSSTGNVNGGGRKVKEDRGWNNDNNSNRGEYHQHQHSQQNQPSNSSSSKNNNRYNNDGNQQQTMTHPPPPIPSSGPGRQSSNQIFPSAGPTAKRGSKACVACRKGKNRCEWDPSGSESSCRRCLINGIQCTFEKPSEKGSNSTTGGGRNRTNSVATQNNNNNNTNNNNGGIGLDGEAENRVKDLEKTVHSLTQSQDQIQNVLQQILQLLPSSQQQNQLPLSTSSTTNLPSFMSNQHHQHHPTAVSTSSIFATSLSPPSSMYNNTSQHNIDQHQQQQQQQQRYYNSGHDGRTEDPVLQAFTNVNNHNNDRMRSPQNTATGRSGFNGNGNGSRDYNQQQQLPTPGKREFPKLPGFAPPAHQFGTYGVIPLPSAPPSPAHSRHSSRSSSSHSATSSSALPRETLTAPIQALQALANAADQIAGKTSPENQLLHNNNADEDEELDIKNIITDENQDSNQNGNGGGGEEDEGERGRSRKRKRTVGGGGKQVMIDPKSISLSLRVKKKKRPDPTPRNPFPDVVTKGLVTELEARELWDIFFKGCHYFVPLWDKSYDTYETFIVRTPFSTDALLAVAAKIRAENGPLGQTFQRCLEEAQGIARSTLFGPIVRKEAVMAMLILSVWSQNGWLPCGHALRMGLDMNLHRALDRLANKDEARSEADERDLVVSARIWLNCYMHEHLVSLGTGKPLLLRDDSSVRGARDLLSHPMASETDMRLVAGVELVNLRIRILEHLTPLHGKIDSATISFVKRMLSDLNSWYKEWYSIHRTRYEDEDVLVKLLETELCYAQLWTVCVALRGAQWDKLAPDQRELAFQAKDASFRCLEIFLRHENFRKHLKYATHDQLVSVAFAAVFLLKIAMLYPTAVPLPFLISQVSQLAHLLSAECFAERYALTLRLMLSNFRRKTGAMSTMPGTPRLSMSAGGNGQQGQTLPFTPADNSNGNGNVISDLDGGLQSLLSLPSNTFDNLDNGNNSNNNNNNNNNGLTNEFGVTDQMWDMTGLEGFNWPTEFSPSALPVWLQDGNVTDLGLPADGSDSLFLPPELANLFLPTTGQTFDQYVLPDSGDVGAEAW
ncbi:uncharacterized protein L201_003090 [Kwoniella dendrophila CBS 6074]|uniref:Zn(2)-C6 fungal-type domain-containing protein n=1 Tax=Kwoniella dendrophila CBS 6074 TaxID=1295534 RepID=A0AAX4JUF1_9TREE